MGIDIKDFSRISMLAAGIMFLKNTSSMQDYYRVTVKSKGSEICFKKNECALEFLIAKDRKSVV